MYRVATPIMPNGHMSRVLYRESGPQVLGLGDSKEAVTLPDVDWGTL